MVIYLVGYKAGNIYLIYHLIMKELKSFHDVIFYESEFIGKR